MESITVQTHKDFLKPLVYLVTFFALAPLTLLITFFALFSLNTTFDTPKTPEKSLLQVPRFGVQVYAALPEEQNSFSQTVTGADARVEIIRQYLEKYNSPLLPFAQLVVATSDQYNLDFRILVAIAQQESNLCKKSPEDSFNCWGWGIHSRGSLGFLDYPTAIEEVAKGIREEYIDKGYDTVEEMMEKYTPLSSGSWATGVNQFLSEME